MVMDQYGTLAANGIVTATLLLGTIVTGKTSSVSDLISIESLNSDLQ